MTIVKYTPLSKTMVQDAILEFCPNNLESFVSEIIDEVYNKTTAMIPITALTTLWSAGKGLQALINGLNSIYHVKETRNWLFTRIRSVFFTLGLLLALLLSLMMLVFGNSLQLSLSRHLPFLAGLLAKIMNARSLLVFLVYMLLFLFLFKSLPNRKATVRSQLPGAVLTSIAWMTFSYCFSIYFTYFPLFSNMYGSLTTIILIMLWLYICMSIVLYGAEINAYFENQFRQASAFARDLLEMEDITEGQLKKDMDAFFEKEEK
jgi:membrane protein